VRKEQKGASKRMNGKLTEGPEENRCSPGGLMHAAAKATWPGDAHDQDASTGSSQVPSRNHSKNLTKNSKERTRKAAPRNSTKSYPNLHDSSPEFAQEKFDLLQIYPQEIIAWD